MDTPATPKDQCIYLAFCPREAAENVYIIGGCLPGQLGQTLNKLDELYTAKADLYSYAWVWKCYDHVHVESRIRTILAQFRQEGDVYKGHYNALYGMTALIVNNCNAEFEEAAADASCDGFGPPHIPKAIQFK